MKRLLRDDVEELAANAIRVRIVGERDRFEGEVRELMERAEAMTEAAIREGLPHHAAEKLVHQTLRGAGMLLSGSEKSAFRLRGEVTSPGGTTAAAMSFSSPP